MKGIHVTSEIGKLKKVCLHRPGDELLNLPPDELERLLFDDVPFLEVAQAEHDRFAEILREQGTEVLYLEQLVAEAFKAHPGAREEFLNEYIEEAGIKGQAMPAIVRDYLNSIEDDFEFVKKTMAGVAKSEIDLPHASSATLDDMVSAHSDKESDLIIDPMPNLYFTRDPFACVGNGVSLNRMYAVTRNRETLYGKYIFKYHPEYADTPLWFQRDAASHIEGGDILNLSNKALAVGISQRTQAAAIDILAQNIFWKTEGCEIEKIFAFDIPNCRAFMHLDTVFTQIDVDKFTIHPAIMGTLRVFELTKGATPGEVDIKEHTDSLEKILEYATGVDGIKLIPCGGGDPIAAAREQWNDGSNTLCVEPGTIVVYQRNNVTNDVLYKEGLNLLVMPSAELSRGRGGPRCMSMPFQREDL
ncbi:arginine deiminase [Slackia faecicanis]|uniref:Arginine deiminase n=1 Tax=Slackia faecicanis TaxID=255723 RepID=A0A3N0AGB7_9ACTN|nr:arginine deiminase [Slackia faecicanis]MDO5358796.1 arginine deiminase [Slackia faecicanis]RNL20862.1 arginine deiminase [Slackia faecicanis]